MYYKSYNNSRGKSNDEWKISSDHHFRNNLLQIMWTIFLMKPKLLNILLMTNTDAHWIEQEYKQCTTSHIKTIERHLMTNRRYRATIIIKKNW